ncbi:MAG: VWA domain-containing protein [Deltaproteobacteria bacterium]|jgi:Ca-activated chloride channel family protein|nr:VWA domain-containing protein [Deltaproteobacteria bacterium]
MNKRIKKILSKSVIFLMLEAVLASFFYVYQPHTGFSFKVPFFNEVWYLLRPAALLLVFLPPVLVLLPSMSDLSRIQRALIFLIRFALFTILALAVAWPAAKKQNRRLSHVYFLDISSSMDDKQLQEAKGILDKLLKRSKSSDVAASLVKFNKNARSVNLKSKKSLNKIRNKIVENTDISEALRLGTSLVPPGHAARFILISDGLETRGNALSTVASLKKQKIPIYHYFPLASSKPEVFISEFSMPASVDIKRPFELSAAIVSNVETSANLSLYQGESPEEMYKGGLESFRKIKLKPGINRFTFKGVVNDLGIQAFRLAMTITEKKRDTVKKNNTAWAVLMAKDKPRVLYLESQPSKGRYFVQALRSGGLEVEVRPPWGFPASITQMKRYSCIIQSDISANYVSTNKMMILTRYVKTGGCYIMVGGENAFGSGGYYQTPIEKLLPVRFDLEKNRRQPSVAMVLVIDRSGSMSGMKIRLAKEAAASTSNLLGARDLVGIIAFDHRPNTVVDLTYAANRSRIEQLIRKITASGGTDIVSALDAANNMLCDARAKVKHVILLSDGQSGRDRLEDVLQQANNCNISISVIGVGSSIDRGMLELIKERGNGRSYYTTDPNDLPRLFTKEASKVARPPLVDEPVKVKVVKSVDFLRGVNIEAAPYLLGYVPTKAKKRAELILVSDVYKEPILARWNFGLGRAIAFTSDIKPRWSRQWLESWSNGFKRFWVNLLRDSMRVKKLEEYQMKVASDERDVIVKVDALSPASRWRNSMYSVVTVTRFGGSDSFNVELPQTAPGRYQARFELPEHGTYMLTSKHFCMPEYAKKAGIKCPSDACPCESKSLIGKSFGSVSYSYPEELKKVQPSGKKCLENPKLCQGLQLLMELSRQTGGEKLNDKNLRKLYKPGHIIKVAYNDRWVFLLWPFLILFILDILLRRVRIFGFHIEE